jgi:hypothetical protein
MRSDGGITSEEHPVPESIGNHELVLPRGVVCDRCYNGPLAALDEALVDSFMIKCRRAEWGIPSKQEVVPASGSRARRAGS